MTLVHIAGHVVRICGRKRQLCAWCGFLLVDVDLANSFTSDGAEPGHWGRGAFVQIGEYAGGSTFASVVVVPDGLVPDGWCGEDKPRLRLVPPEAP